MKKLLLLASLVSLPAFGSPFVVTNTLDTGTAQCGVFLDAAAKVTIPVTSVTGGNICKFDVGTVSVGSHTVSMSAITVNDPVWGSQESAKSSPLTFSRPAAPAVPAGLSLQP